MLYKTKGRIEECSLKGNEEQEKLEQFIARIEAGEKIEADDWMPEEYRNTLIKLISMHGISEIMGALPEKEWVPKAPTFRKLGSWQRCKTKWDTDNYCFELQKIY